MRLNLKLLLLSTQLFSIALADYAWIPQYQEWKLKAGWEYLKSSENFDTDGQRADLTTLGEPSELSQHQFYLDTEYGISPSLAIRARFGFATVDAVAISDGTSLASGSGLSDTYLGLKWNFKEAPFLLTPEIGLNLATQTDNGRYENEIVSGEGVSSTATVLHGGYRLSKYFVAALSPGMLWRFSGYPPQFTVDGAFSVVFRPVYLRLFWSGAWALRKEARAATLTSNPIFGSGGSFSRLSENRDSLWLGAKFGGKFAKHWNAEINFAHSLMGSEAAHGLCIGVAVGTTFDFYKEDPGPSVKEIPLDSTDQ